MIRTASGFRSFALVISLFAAGLQAADSPKEKNNFAVTDIAKVDADFAFQGEFLGCGNDGCYRGIQVVAIGKGEFEIYLLNGGLPGAGWDRQNRTKVVGKLNGDSVVGRDDHYQVTIHRQSATWQNAAGQSLATLERIHRVSPTFGKAPPAGATVLFDGSTPTNLVGAKLTADGLLEIGSTTAMPVQDFQLHVEFRTPYMPFARGQARGNSGVYIQHRYELQVLDSFGLEGVENECGGLYRQQRPDVNMCLPPLSWQTYDIHFTAARFNAEGKKTAPARITVYHNGEPIHLNREIKDKTGAGQKEGPDPRPIHFQNHGNPVNFRNMWIVLGSSSPAACSPCHAAACDSPSCHSSCEPSSCKARCEHRGRRRCR